jgi:DNA-binding SARP family transcriptional activator
VPGGLRIAILGPLEVRARSGLPVEVAGARLRRLLLRLALDPGRVVTSAQLVDAVWDDHPPAGAANALYWPVRAISWRTCWAWATTS